MRIPRLYMAPPLIPHETVALDEKQSHYLTRVLRMEVGRPLVVFDGLGREAQARIVSMEKRHAHVLIEALADGIDRESPLYTHLAVGLSRGERMDWVLQKATELGVTEITPIVTSRTEVKLKGERLQKKRTHWQQVTVSACEQCQRSVVPRLNPVVPIEHFLSTPASGLKLVLHHRSAQKLKQLGAPTSLTLLIGPEGGLSDDEIANAINKHNYLPLTLGPRVLRTETAPLVALAAAQLLWGDLG